jgi:aryl-alcohol dehydrogenase (NADP+)
VESLKAVCESRGVNLATASVAWVLGQPGITAAIVGASRAEQLDATLAAPKLKLDDEIRAAFDAVWWELPRRPVSR